MDAQADRQAGRQRLGWVDCLPPVREFEAVRWANVARERDGEREMEEDEEEERERERRGEQRR